MPSLRKAIKYNGEYWHKDRKEVDREKADQCSKKDINLLVINDFDWSNEKVQTMNQIKQWIL